MPLVKIEVLRGRPALERKQVLQAILMARGCFEVSISVRSWDVES